jgi:hypothetical protein
MKNVSEVEHDTIPYARSFPPVLSLRASLTLTANTVLLPVRGGRDLRPHRVGISPSHSDSRDQAQKEAGQKRKDTPGPPASSYWCHAARLARKRPRAFFPSLAASAMLSKKPGEHSTNPERPAR